MSAGGEPYPNLFLVGAPKCGTTALANYLDDLRCVFVSTPKEPLYWSQEDIPRARHEPIFRSLDEYLQLFERARLDSRCKYAVDASTRYLYSETAIRRIEQTTSDARYIVLARDPITAVPALFAENRLSGWEASESLDNALSRNFDAPTHHPTDYVGNYSYGAMLRRLLDTVDRTRVLVILQEDMRAEPSAAWRACLSFLNMPDDGRLEFPSLNTAGTARFPRLHRLIIDPPSLLEPALLGLRSRMASALPRNVVRSVTRKPAPRPALSENSRRRLVGHLREDVTQFAALSGLRLSRWSDEWTSAAE